MAKTRLQLFLEGRTPHKTARLEREMDVLYNCIGTVEHNRVELDTVIGMIDEKQARYHELTGRYYREKGE